MLFFQAEDGIRDYKVTGVQTCFFFQAEDGIRDYKVTGVQTCALPIYKVTGVQTCALPIYKVTGVDRKSTRLNSSHLVISYAVFCLKKKKKLSRTIGIQNTRSTPTPTYRRRKRRAS